jgi:hypothetical protein
VVSVTWRVSSKKQELLILREHINSLQFFVLSYNVSLLSKFHVVVSVTISTSKRYSVRIYFQFVEGGLSCLICVICSWLQIVASNTFCVVILLCLSLSCVPYVASFSGFSILIAPSVFSNVYIIFVNTCWEHLGLPLCFRRVRVENRFSCLCCVVCLVYLRSVSCAQCSRCL